MADQDRERLGPECLRKGGNRYKDGNTREDGSYQVGRDRPPEHSRFKKGDGRKRGRRAPGTRNLSTDWQEELAETVELSEGGKKKRVTKQRGIVKATAAKAMKGSERAAEIAFRYGAAREAAATSKVRIGDREIIKQWLAQIGLGSATSAVTDDLDTRDGSGPVAPEEGDHADN